MGTCLEGARACQGHYSTLLVERYRSVDRQSICDDRVGVCIRVRAIIFE